MPWLLAAVLGSHDILLTNVLYEPFQLIFSRSFCFSVLFVAAHARNLSPGSDVHLDFQDLEYPDIERRYVLYAFAASCSARDIAYWNCTYCTDSTNGTEVVMYNYDKNTDTNALVAINHFNQESKIKLSDPKSMSIPYFEAIFCDYTVIVTFRGTKMGSLTNWYFQANPRSQLFLSYHSFVFLIELVICISG